MFFQHALKHCAKDGRRNAAPIQFGTGDKLFAQFGIERRNAGVFRKQCAVDVGKAGEVFVKVVLAIFFRCVQYLEELGQHAPDIAAVCAGGFHESPKNSVLAKDAGIFGKQAE